MTLLKNWSSIITFTSGAVVMFLMRQIKYSTIYETLKEKIYNWKNNNYNISELPNPNWIKIGKVKELHIHPLASGDRTKCSKLKFTPYGAITKQKGLILQDKMFHIYDEKTKQFQNTHTRTAIQLVRADMLSESHVQFSLADYKVTIDLDKEIRDNRKIVRELKTSWIEIKYIDCGEEVAKWLNNTLCTSTLRIVRVEYDIIDEPIMEKDMMKKNTDDEAWLNISPGIIQEKRVSSSAKIFGNFLWIVHYWRRKCK
ncbi:hypothetical protein ALC60_00466 [Trachymyrmex zeteki]|uniref:Molybdenum cofactor sulfurase middle domain-containing protein n=1 Tax=Mycetomoellerius zeteki TaxID=64791 RepID=A0A151XJ87_9HYME|nr:hypothetical protein ALC60_00466 [Trachymyrmex zeteki]